MLLVYCRKKNKIFLIEFICLQRKFVKGKYLNYEYPFTLQSTNELNSETLIEVPKG